MHPKELRRQILQKIYDSNDRYFFDMGNLTELELQVGARELHNAIRYLEGHYYLEIMGPYMGKEFLNYVGLKITSSGIDLVEDPDEYNKLFSVKINNFGDISHSNINIESNHNSQQIEIHNISDEVLELLKGIKVATDKKDNSKLKTLMSTLMSASMDIFLGVVSSGIYQFIIQNGIKL